MTIKEKAEIERLMEKTLICANLDYEKRAKEEFLRSFTFDVNENPGYLIELLETAYEGKEADSVEYIFYVMFTFDIITSEFADILIKLFESDWHTKHEDIASIFQELKCPESVESLYKIALTQFEYLDYDDSYALAVKCIWALGAINTNESRNKLELLSASENRIIRSNALKQISMY